MKRNNEPDRSRGGTFIRDRDGNLIQYIPPTRPHDAPVDREALIERVVEKIDSTIDLVERIADQGEPPPAESEPCRRNRNRNRPTTEE